MLYVLYKEIYNMFILVLSLKNISYAYVVGLLHCDYLITCDMFHL